MRRLLLFDIDGTLTWGGPAKDAFCEAMLEVYGTIGDVENVSFSGKTDPQIARELLATTGCEGSCVDEGLPALWEGYTRRLEAGLVDDPVEILPGVPELLRALGQIDDIGVALLTGNIVRGAQLKLGSAGLWDHFALGSFGSDHEDRNELPPIALERAREAWRPTLEADDTIIVGDTPRDVSCGRKNGMRTMAVATGYFSVEQLTATGADHVLEDLSATEQVITLLTE